jgi:hypothetical protein
MEDVCAGVDWRAEGSPLDLLDGGDKGVTGLLRVCRKELGASGSALTIICSPGLRPRLASGSSGITVSPLGGYPAFTVTRKGKGDVEYWPGKKLHTTLARRKNA